MDDRAHPRRVDAAPVVARLRAAGCVYAEDEAALLIGSGRTGAALEGLVAQRVAGRPLEYVLGWAEFAGLRIPVTDGVFVPRRRTELLARAAIEHTVAARMGPVPDRPPVVVDLCCGAGALGAAVADRSPGIELHAADIDPDAVACARAAIAPFGGQVYLGDLYEPLPPGLRGRVRTLMVNAPYVPTAEIALMPGEARQFEHPAALDGGADGLDVVRRAVTGAARWLAPRGALLMECAEHQSGMLAAAVSAAGLVPQVRRDEDLDATVVIAVPP